MSLLASFPLCEKPARFQRLDGGEIIDIIGAPNIKERVRNLTRPNYIPATQYTYKYYKGHQANASSLCNSFLKMN
jgi:hypothetical protein